MMNTLDCFLCEYFQHGGEEKGRLQKKIFFFFQKETHVHELVC